VTIRWQREPDSLRLVRVETIAALTELHQHVSTVEAQARDTRRRVRALRDGLLADHRRRVLLEHRASLQERADAPHLTREEVRAARLGAGLSQRELARELGLPRSCVAMAEAGRREPSPRLARWAAGVLKTMATSA
jgi:DNA-binding transcriptional regulator YiaG